MALVEIHQLQKSFRGPEGRRHLVLDVPEFVLESRTQVALCGESGLGKTTLLHLIAGILKPDAGTILVGGERMSHLSEAKRDRLRAMHIGYIFQSFHLLPGFTCLENVLLGMTFGPGPDRVRARELLERMRLASHMRHYPRQLSAGQQQRLAVARALANRPQLVLADEPTGNLDTRNAGEALKLIRESCRESGAALLFVTHDRQVLGEFDRVEELRELNRARTLGEEEA